MVLASDHDSLYTLKERIFNAMQQQTCPNCGHRNRPGIIFCENCGASLLGHSPIGTKSLGGTSSLEAEPGNKSDAPGQAQAQPTPMPPAVNAAIASVGSDMFKTGWSLRMEVEGGQTPVILVPRQELILGRRDPATGAMPDLDMTPFAGYRMGVSRRHAAIRLAEGTFLDLWDLGSSNGTFLNGTRLVAYRPYRLRDGDEIRLGQMAIHAYFQPPKS
jgi:hypothetical protein